MSDERYLKEGDEWYYDPTISRSLAKVCDLVNSPPQPDPKFTLSVKIAIGELWSFIINRQFGREGYFISQKEIIWESETLFLGYHLHYRGPPYWHGLTLVYKEPDYCESDTNNKPAWLITEDTWNRGVEVLFKELKRSIWDDIVYGAVVIGTGVRFFKYTGPMSSGPELWDPLKTYPEPYNLASDGLAVQRILNEIIAPPFVHDIDKIIDCRKTQRLGVQYKVTYFGNWDKWNTSPPWQHWTDLTHARDRILAFHAANPNRPPAPQFFEAEIYEDN